MNRSLHILCILAAAAGACGALAQASPSVEVRFENPERFTDLRVDRSPSARERDGLLDELRAWIAREAPRYMPAGSKLSVTVTDVDMAGEFELWQRTAARDVRVIREIYPSRVSLAFHLVDAAGKVVKEGDRKLVSAMLYSDTLRGGDGPLRYEKMLLHEWLAREFAGLADGQSAR